MKGEEKEVGKVKRKEDRQTTKILYPLLIKQMSAIARAVPGCPPQQNMFNVKFVEPCLKILLTCDH